ncbi:MAG: hypothetical protein U9N72_12855 [Bacteroidota bacterium]|nr:hypothetical protein [Bacteroidota bacterium]
MKKVLGSVSIIALIIVLAGCLFKIMHWPAAGILFALGAATFIIIGLLWLFIRKRDPLMIMLGIALIILFTAFLWEAQAWPGGNILFWASVIVTFILGAVVYSKKE